MLFNEVSWMAYSLNSNRRDYCPLFETVYIGIDLAKNMTGKGRVEQV
jgi:hypothetical protein